MTSMSASNDGERDTDGIFFKSKILAVKPDLLLLVWAIENAEYRAAQIILNRLAATVSRLKADP